MITFSQLGKKGNLGNQLFQIASTVGIAKKNGHDFFFPYWDSAGLFENKLPEGIIDDSFSLLRINNFEYCDLKIGEGNYNLNGWLQSEQYFDIPATRKMFAFNKAAEEEFLACHSELFAKKTILISVRRGDFVGHPHYFQLSYKYYISALLEFFPDYETRNLVFISDDIDYCKYHFGFLKNVFFLAGIAPVGQLILASHCDDYIISNSTFSWWAAWLGEKPNTKIVCPLKNLAGAYGTQNDDRDYFPLRWIKFDHRKKRIPLSFLPLIFKGEVYRYVKFLKLQVNKANWRFKKRIKRILKKPSVSSPADALNN